jgi:phosphopantetheinyl transferase (holo-ACP synthase)
MRIRPFVEIISLQDISLNRGAIEAACFDPRESAPQLPVRTIAGFLCIKKAVVAAARSADTGSVCREKDIIVGHDGYGAARVVDMPAAVRDRLRGMCISVTHTADFACGCAVVEEDNRDA